MRKLLIILSSLILACVSSVPVIAEETSSFSHIEWNSEFTSLPMFSKTINLSDDFRNYDYSVHLEYPEYVQMSASEVDSLKKYTYQPGEQIVVNALLGVSRKRGILDVNFVPIIKKGNKYFRLNSCKIVVDKKQKAARAKSLKAEDETGTYASHSVLSKGKWAKIRVKDEGIYALTPSFISSLGFSDLSRIKVYG